MKNRYRMIALLGLLVFISTVTSGHAAKKYDGQTMQVMVGITPLAAEQVRDYIAPKLKEKWGIEVAVEAVGTSTQIEKIIIMKDNPRVTITGWDAPIGIKAAEMGLCAPISRDKVPNFKQLYDWAFTNVGGELKVLSANLTGIGIIYNEDEFKKNKFTPPTSWLDLWKKEYAGRVSITSPESMWGVATLVTIARLEGGGEKNIEPGFKKLKTLMPNVHTIHTWSSELVKVMQLNEVWVGTTGSNMAPSMREKGYPAKWAAPKEGSPMVNGGFSIVAKAPYQDVAHDFFDIYFSPEFQLRRVRESGVISPNKMIWDMLSAKERENMPISPSMFDKLTQLDWATIDRDRAAWTERWKKEMK